MPTISASGQVFTTIEDEVLGPLGSSASHSYPNCVMETLLEALPISVKLDRGKVQCWKFVLTAELSATGHMMTPNPFTHSSQASLFFPTSEVEIKFFRMEVHNSEEADQAFWKPSSRNRRSRRWCLQGPAFWVLCLSVGQRCETSTNDISSIYCRAGMPPRVPENIISAQSSAFETCPKWTWRCGAESAGPQLGNHPKFCTWRSLGSLRLSTNEELADQLVFSKLIRTLGDSTIVVTFLG